MEIVSKIVIIALVAGIFWWVLQPRYLFVVTIENGIPRVTRGKVTVAFLQQLGQACAEMGLSHGWIGGVYRGRYITLVFSRSIPSHLQQRFRNLWSLRG